MEVVGTIGGGGLVIKRFQAGTAVTVAGIPVTASIVATTDLAMVEPMPASAVSQLLAGIGLDTAPDVAATGLTTASDILLSVVINPDALIRGKMSGGATADTALTATATTGASAGGTVTTGVTTIDDSAIWGYDGGNAGVLRRADDAAGSVSMNFPTAIATGDRFLVANGYPLYAAAASANAFLDLTSNLAQFDASASVTDTDNFVIVDLDARDVSEDGTTNSFYIVVANDHIFGGNAQRS